VVVVIGSREFTRKDWVDKFLARLADETLIISGGAKSGVDLWVKEYCEANPRRVSYKEIPVTRAEWELVGNYAGPLRNEVIMFHVSLFKKRGVSVAVVAFSEVGENGVLTPGTLTAILAARKYALPVYIYTT
jgi:hypothetical protein